MFSYIQNMFMTIYVRQQRSSCGSSRFPTPFSHMKLVSTPALSEEKGARLNVNPHHSIELTDL